MRPRSSGGELDRACDFVRARREPFHQRAVFDRNTSQGAGQDLTIGAVHGDRPFSLAGARSNGNPPAALSRLVSLFQATVARTHLHPNLSAAERNWRTILCVKQEQ